MSRTLNKTLLVSASVLMLASVGTMSASAVNNPVNASHIRINRQAHRNAVRYAPLNNKDLRFAKSYVRTPSEYDMSERAQGAKRIANGSHKFIRADCASFVWGVMKHSDRQVTAQPWTASNMFTQDGGTLKQVKASHAKRGDVVMNDEHMGILLQRYHGKNTKMVEMGGINDHINVSTIGKGFGVVNKGLRFGEPMMAQKRLIVKAPKAVKSHKHAVKHVARRHHVHRWSLRRLFHFHRAHRSTGDMAND